VTEIFSLNKRRGVLLAWWVVMATVTTITGTVNTEFGHGHSAILIGIYLLLGDK